MPTRSLGCFISDDTLVSLGLDFGGDCCCLDSRIVWDDFSTALLALGLDRVACIYHLLVPSSRVRARGYANEFSLHHLPTDARRRGVGSLHFARATVYDDSSDESDLEPGTRAARAAVVKI